MSKKQQIETLNITNKQLTKKTSLIASKTN